MQTIKLTPEAFKIAYLRQQEMPINTLTRLRINNELSDIVIEKVSSGLYFYYSPNTIDRRNMDLISFHYYGELEKYTNEVTNDRHKIIKAFDLLKNAEKYAKISADKALKSGSLSTDGISAFQLGYLQGVINEVVNFLNEEK
jgi:hypothetical protein